MRDGNQMETTMPCKDNFLFYFITDWNTHHGVPHCNNAEPFDEEKYLFA